MGGRGSSFSDREVIDGILDKLNKKHPKSDSILVYGDVKKDFESGEKNRLTKELKNSNISICQSMDKMSKPLKDTNLQQISDLAQKYTQILGDNLTAEDLKIRCFDMNNKSLKTLRETPNFTVKALFEPKSGQICFNTRSVISNEQLSAEHQEQQKTHFSVPTDKDKENLHVITHEFGHFIENCIIENRLKKNIHAYSEYIKEKRNEHRAKDEEIRSAEAKKITRDIMIIANEKYGAKRWSDFLPSEYGRENHYEWFAEVFAETNLHTTNNPLVNAMKDFLKEESK